MADPLSGRQLQEAVAVRPSEMVDVIVMFGMKIVGESPLLGVSKDAPYEFDPNFNLQDPWAQRRFEALCTTMQDQKDLQIGSTRCWLLGFRDYWIAKGKDWPMRPTEDLDKEVFWYANNVQTDGLLTTTFFWFVDQKVKATYAMMFLNVPKTISSDRAMEIMGKWDEYIQTFNGKVETAIKGVWHASKLWVRAEAEKVILDSTLVTLGISLGCVFLGIVLFTFSIHLAFLVMLVVMSIIICLLFFMTVIMAWPIGAIEVLSLIVFVGFAVDYCLHVAHKYHSCHINAVIDMRDEEDKNPISSESPARGSPKRPSLFSRHSLMSTSSEEERRRRPSIVVDDIVSKSTTGGSAKKKVDSALLMANRPEERFTRTKYALERMGGAVVGSSFTTVGCAAFLIPCQLAIFVKIGSVVMAVTIYAILYTVLALPALLMLCGPCSQDMRGIIHWFKAALIPASSSEVERKLHKREEERHEDPNAPRRYVLHMPTRAMGAVGHGFPAVRSRIIATG